NLVTFRSSRRVSHREHVDQDHGNNPRNGKRNHRHQPLTLTFAIVCMITPCVIILDRDIIVSHLRVHDCCKSHQSVLKIEKSVMYRGATSMSVVEEEEFDI